MTLAVGSRLGPYEIVAPLGSGGMGEVYRARDPRLRRDVAVKVLISGADASPEQVRRFEDEARAAGALNHPNVLSVFDVGSEGGSHYVVFELLEGTTLRERLLRGPLAHRKAVEYAVQVCRGLAAAHGKGIVHRDLKPGNLFLTSDGQVKILDFGLAKLTQALGPAEAASGAATQTATSPGRVVGTLGYMSPEHLRGETADARSDLFAVGATLYEMLSGRPAFQRDSPAETMSAILNHEPPPLGASAEGLSLAALDPVVRRCLEKNPEERFQSARDLAFALTALSDPTPAGRAITPSPGWTRWLASAAVILAVAGGFMLTRWPRGRLPTPMGPLTVVPFTSFPGVETAPTFSPDGSQIAFAWSPEGTEDRFDLYVKVIGSEKALRLTQDPSIGLFPAWSPDGRQIAFSRWLGGEGSGIYLVPALGGGERKIAETSPGYELSALLSWSPDARLLAYSDRSVVLLDVATLEKHEVGNPAKDCKVSWVPAFSPDGESLAFACMVSDNVNRLFLMPFPRGNARSIALVQGDLTGLSWSEDGKYLIFARDGDLWRVEASGGEPEKLLSGRDVSLPAVARSGRRLAYAQHQVNVNIWRVPLDGSGRTAGTPARLVSSSRHQNNPAFSPDGRRLAFESDRSGTYEIWICGADGSDPQRLTSFGGPLTGSPRWSPDGRRLAFDSRATGESAIYVVGADGGVPQRVQTGLPDSQTPEWSKDGRWLYFAAPSKGRDQLFRVPSEGGAATQLTQDAGLQPQESGDGRRVYYFRRSDGHAEMWSVSTGGRDERPVPGMQRVRQDWGGEWTVGSSGIYFVQGDPPAGIGFFDFATGRIRRVAAIPGKPQPFGTRLGLSPDESAVLYSQIDGVTGDIMLVESFQ